MRFIVFIIILSPFLWGGVPVNKSQTLPKTYITLNAKKGCSVHVAAWISPSCTHCAEYFASDIPKITAMPGFCLDLHFFPHLYLLDKPISILILSQGPDNVLKNADLFFKNQNRWLEISASREAPADREEDLRNFLKDLEERSSKSAEEIKKNKKIKNYLVASDPFLYVKMFALNHFSIEHLERYLPKGDGDLISELSLSLVKDLPRKDGVVVNFSPAFTDMYSQLIPDEKLYHGILTPSIAEDMLKAASPFVPRIDFSSSATLKRQFAEKARKEIEIDDDIQYADDEIEEGSEVEKYADSEENMDTEDTDQYIADKTTEHSKKIEKILDKVVIGMADEESESYQHILSN